MQRQSCSSVSRPLCCVCWLRVMWRVPQHSGQAVSRLALVCFSKAREWVWSRRVAPRVGLSMRLALPPLGGFLPAAEEARDGAAVAGREGGLDVFPGDEPPDAAG